MDKFTLRQEGHTLYIKFLEPNLSEADYFEDFFPALEEVLSKSQGTLDFLVDLGNVQLIRTMKFRKRMKEAVEVIHAAYKPQGKIGKVAIFGGEPLAHALSSFIVAATSARDYIRYFKSAQDAETWLRGEFEF